MLPGVRLSFSLSQRRHVAATRRNAFEGQPESRCAVHVRLYHSHTTCDFAHCSLDRKTSCDKRTEATLASRVRRPASPWIAYTLTHARGLLIAVQTLDRRRERHIRRRFDSGYQRQNARDWPIQHGGGGACNGGRNRAAASTTIGGTLIQRLGYRSSLLGLSGIALRAFALLWFTVPETFSNNGGNSRGETGISYQAKKEFFAQ